MPLARVADQRRQDRHLGAGLGPVIDAHADEGLAHGGVCLHVLRRVEHLEDATLDPARIPLPMNALRDFLREDLRRELVDVALLEKRAPTDRRRVLDRQREVQVLHDLLLDEALHPSQREPDRRERDGDAPTLPKHARGKL